MLGSPRVENIAYDGRGSFLEFVWWMDGMDRMGHHTPQTARAPTVLKT